MGKLKASIYMDADLMIWVIAQAKEEGSSVSHFLRWCVYEAKARSDMRSMKP